MKSAELIHEKAAEGCVQDTCRMHDRQALSIWDWAAADLSCADGWHTMHTFKG